MRDKAISGSIKVNFRIVSKSDTTLLDRSGKLKQKRQKRL